MNFTQLLPSPSDIQCALVSTLSTYLSRRKVSNTIIRPQEDFDIDPITGFLPPEALPRLPAEYQIWEEALSEAPEVLRLSNDMSDAALALREEGETWRMEIRSRPTLEVNLLKDNPRLLQRAHVVLTWLVQYYVHSLPSPHPPTPKRIPASLAVPLVNVSRMLGIAPILTFADTITWNWELIRPDQPATIDNMKLAHNFSGTDDERHFYQVQAAVELHGTQVLRIIDDFYRIPNLDDLTSVFKVVKDLTRLTAVIEEISELIQSMRSACDPHVFYWDIRPWEGGSDSKGPSHPGWIYEGVDPSAPELQYLSGPSGGQSVVMHALDLFLDIDHKLQTRRHPGPSAENKRADRGFMERMRRYMLGKHRAYLEQIENSPRSIRELAQHTAVLREPYNNAVKALKSLRTLHMRIACLYVINMSKTANPRSVCPMAVMMERQANTMEARGRDEKRDPIRGTGGTDLVTLLKAGRDATARAVLEK
ncbi:Indoleamine 2,3-dioxygenase [Lentinula raphanica]|nr:Indoleamine 2,3-dioxygenase [Lentinula raphanica]KAJ3822623.1 Indoleamine 2,3-dioxygenase [Lentinula raphanica]KAJ3968369.1 Indoleamine 2,3-dioxygenase [Lentinula raphanica]